MSSHDHLPGDGIGRRKGAKYLVLAAISAVAALVGVKPAKAGYGRCSKCNCPAYEGNQDTCGNCGHNYQAHW